MRGSQTFFLYVDKYEPATLGRPLVDSLVGATIRLTVSRTLEGQLIVMFG